jgi:DNA-binding response OmpR family regulator
VLVVEDEPLLRELFRWTLQDTGLTVEVARDGREAVTWLADHRPSAVVLDWSLPHLDGGGVVAALRALHGPVVPVVLATADPRPADKAADIGARACLPKPFDLDRLVDAVWAALPTTPSHAR